MDLELKNRRALVAGGAGGIGAAVCAALAAEGANVCVHGRDEAAARSTAAEIAQEIGRELFTVSGDLATEEGANDMALVSARHLGGPVEILVNCVGTYTATGWQETSVDDWVRSADANLFSAVRLVHAVLPAMREAGWGRIVQLASAAGIKPFPVGPDYGAAKAGLINLGSSLAKALAGTGVTVNTVSPGIVLTQVTERLYRSRAEAEGWGEDWAAIEARAVAEDWPNPIGRFARGDEVAAFVAYLASPRAAYLTGANHRFDGGGIGTVA